MPASLTSTKSGAFPVRSRAMSNVLSLDSLGADDGGMSGNFHDVVSMLAAKSRKADSLQERLAAAEAAMHAAAQRSGSLKNSTSWRLTRPLRSSVDFARRAILSRTSKLNTQA